MSVPDARKALLDTGRRLALSCTLAQVHATMLCAEAKVGLDAFERHFASFRDYLAALQQDFMDGLRDKIFAVTTGTVSPLMRLKLASETYLQGCLAERSLRSWLLEARGQSELAEGVRKQNQVYAMFIAPEFKTLGWPHPAAAARIYLAMINEAANAEHRAGHAVSSVRETLWDFLERGGGPAT